MDRLFQRHYYSYLPHRVKMATIQLPTQVASSFHNGNTMLGGHHLDKDIIKRMAALNLEIDFDLYADGNKFNE